MDKKINYSTVTELPGQKATKEQLERLYTRYSIAQKFSNNKRILELACGPGLGLSLISKKAREVFACDIDKKILQYVKKNYHSEKIKIKNIDANNKLPFKDNSFDTVLLLEAIYYIKNQTKVLREINRILRRKESLLLSFPNKDAPDFNPSQYSTKYFSIPELHAILSKNFSNIKLYGFSPIENGPILFIKKIAINLGLIPKSMKNKAILKRIFFGKLYPIPKQLEENKDLYLNQVELDSSKINKQFKVLFVVATKN